MWNELVHTLCSFNSKEFNCRKDEFVILKVRGTFHQTYLFTMILISWRGKEIILKKTIEMRILIVVVDVTVKDKQRNESKWERHNL